MSQKNNNSMKKPYNKPWISVDQQLELLKNRKLIINNEQKAKKYLLNLNYYRLSGYWYKKQDSNDFFLDKTTFKSIINEYYFDKELRKILFNVIETIEISFRTSIAYYMSEYLTPFPIVENNYLLFTKASQMKKMIKTITL
ncbi:MAG: Abi family protein [Sphaerochaetaceae bacterium]